MSGIEVLLGLFLLAFVAVALAWTLLRSNPPAKNFPARTTAPTPSFIVAVDGLKESARAIDLACGLAAERQAKLILANVIPVPMRYTLDAPLPEKDYRAKAILESAAARVNGRNVEYESRIVKDRTVAAGLVELALAMHASMVIVGFDGSVQNGLHDLVEVSDLFRHAPCEILIAREPVPPEEELRQMGRLIETTFRS